MTVPRTVWRLLQLLRVVGVPDGVTTSHLSAERCVPFRLVSPRQVPLERTPQKWAASPEEIAVGAVHGRARRLVRCRGYAWYRVDRSLEGRAASGHWTASRRGELVLRAIALVDPDGYPINPDLVARPR